MADRRLCSKEFTEAIYVALKQRDARTAERVAEEIREYQSRCADREDARAEGESTRSALTRVAKRARELAKAVDGLDASASYDLALAMAWAEDGDVGRCGDFLRILSEDVTAYLADEQRARHRPTDRERRSLAIHLGEILRLRGYRVTKGRDGVFARVLQVAFFALGVGGKEGDVSRYLRYAHTYQEQLQRRAASISAQGVHRITIRGRCKRPRVRAVVL